MSRILFTLLIMAALGCQAQKPLLVNEAVTKPVAFPGAEGFGKYATGGRGGEIRIVTNLNDEGEGSLRKAVSAGKPRIVVFAVSGTIHLQSKLNIKGDVTIAGQTASGEGICIADYPVSLTGDNIIIRYLRFRMGDRYQNAGMVDGAGGDDAFGASGKKNIIIDHCSISWSTDEAISIYRGDSTTLQWNIISEPLNYSYHFEKDDKDYESHGYGGIWGGSHFSAHHNLIAHCNSRTPRFNGTRLGAMDETADFRNNIIYNWGHNNIYGGEAGNYNIVNNYYKFGPSTNKNVKYRIANPWDSKKAVLPFGKWYVAGNYVDEAPDITKENSKGIDIGEKNATINKNDVLVNKAINVIEIPVQTAADAYKSVLESAGASLPVRDTLDQRIINDVKNRTGRFIDVQGGYSHGTAYEQTMNAWPDLKQKAPPPDFDKDGMPDDWEIKNGLNPKSKNDASIYSLNKNYTNIELYINGL